MSDAIRSRRSMALFLFSPHALLLSRLGFDGGAISFYPTVSV
jgi:hypothetical protein